MIQPMSVIGVSCSHAFKSQTHRNRKMVVAKCWGMEEIQKIWSKGANFQLQEGLSSEDLKYSTDNGILLYTLKL